MSTYRLDKDKYHTHTHTTRARYIYLSVVCGCHTGGIEGVAAGTDIVDQAVSAHKQ
jgi:hypothetical protein